MSQVNEYFDYIWGEEDNQIGDQFLCDLPGSMKNDILVCKYRNAIQNSIIFKDDSGAIDISMTISIIKLMEIRKYMTNEFILKCGQEMTETLIVLEGRTLLVSGSH